MWKCPKCGESLHDYEESCWNCRAMSAAAPAAQPGNMPPGNVVSEAKKKCPFCAEEIRAEAIKCRYCGSAMPETQQRPEPKKKAQEPAVVEKRSYAQILKNVLIAILILLATVGAIWGAFILYKPIYDKISSKPAATDGSGQDINVKGVAYEEILEYDGKGNVKKTLKTYPQEKGKSK